MSAFVATELALILAGFVPIALVVATARPAASAAGGLAVVIIAGLRFAYLLGSGERRLFEMTFWLFTYVFMGMAQVVQVRTGIAPGTTPWLRRDLNDEASFAVLLSVAAFLLGGHLHAHSRRPAAPDPRPAAAAAVNEGRARMLAYGALLAATYYIARVGLGPLFNSREALSLQVQAVWSDPTTAALVGAVAKMPLLVAFTALLHARRQRAAEGRHAPRLLVVVVAVVLLVVVNPISSARYSFGTVALGMLTVLGMYATPGRFRLVGAGSMLALILLFPIADAFRDVDRGAVKSVGPLTSMTTGDFDAFAQLNNAVYFVEAQGSTLGGQALGVALFWVPRAIWPTKPPDTGTLLAVSRGYGFTNLSAPLQAELLVNGSWPALLLGMATFGYFVRRWDADIAATLRLVPAPGVLYCILPGYLIILLRGSLLQATAYLVVIVAAGAWVTCEPDIREEVGSGDAAGDDCAGRREG